MPFSSAAETFMETLKQGEISAGRNEDIEHMAYEHRRVHRAVLQSTATAFGVGLPST
jgi:hypothetical protein